MLTTLSVGPKTFPINLIQAPLAGVSCAPFRELVWRFGGVAYCCTEMLSAQHLAQNIDRSPRYHTKFQTEGPLCWQLSGNKPDVLARASARAIELDADIIDLNCGCPQPKIRKKGCGSRLLQDEKHLAMLVNALRQDPTIPVTVKIRIDAGFGEFCDVSIAKMCEQAGIDALIVHGRHWTHDYTTPVQTDAIAKIVASVSIPVIANGDVENAASLQRVFNATNCAGFMIGRASVGRPWLFQKIVSELKDENFAKPSQSEIGQLFLQHIEGLIKLDGEHQAILQCRKFGKYYAREMLNKDEFLLQLYRAKTLGAVENCVLRYFN